MSHQAFGFGFSRPVHNGCQTRIVSLKTTGCRKSAGGFHWFSGRHRHRC